VLRRITLTCGVLACAVAIASCSASSDHSDPQTPPASGAGTSPATTTSAAASTEPVASAGCASTTPAPTDTATFSADGRKGTYLIGVPPAAAAGTPRPVVFNLHGLGENPQIQEMASAVAAFGKTHGFVTITPALTEPGTPRWDFNQGSADLAWIGDLITEVERTQCVDERRVFFTGLSMGAFTTSSVACVFADRVAAVAPVAGVQAPEWCQPSRAVPVIAFHGTKDPYVGFDGGGLSGGAVLPGVDKNGMVTGTGEKLVQPSTQPVPQIVAAWAARNKCTSPTDTSVAADVKLTAYACPAGADVELYAVQGGGHTWPGGPKDALPENLVGKTTQSISANELMWAFFQAHPLTGALSQ
jgi:polyhydroxybutyrate depolymerase